MSSHKKKIYVIGGTIQQAQEYCMREGLLYPDAFVLSGAPAAVHAVERHADVRLIGTFHHRMDAPFILDALRMRLADLSDLTVINTLQAEGVRA